jgi:hypothetical protein
MNGGFTYFPVEGLLNYSAMQPDPVNKDKKNGTLVIKKSTISS